MNIAVSEKDLAVIRGCALFVGLTDEEIERALEFYGAGVEGAEKGEMLLRPGDRLTHFGLVLSGLVHVCSNEIDGARNIMAAVSAGGIFGEALCYLKTTGSSVYIAAAEPSRILWLRTDGIVNGSNDAFSLTLSRRFMTMVSKKLLRMNDRIQVLSKKTIREKLRTYFSQCVRDGRSLTFTIPLDREALADYLGVNRSALSRELGQMQKEKMIVCERNRFTILPSKDK